MTLHHYLILAAVLFCVGLMGAFTRRNAIVVLFSIEIMLNAANLNFIAFWRFSENPDALHGPLFTLFTIAVAAAEVAVGLALVIALSGLADVDSAIITVGSLSPGLLEGQIATIVIIAPVLANTLFKGATALAIAGLRKGWKLALPLVLSVAASLAVLPTLLV